MRGRSVLMVCLVASVVAGCGSGGDASPTVRAASRGKRATLSAAAGTTTTTGAATTTEPSTATEPTPTTPGASAPTKAPATATTTPARPAATTVPAPPPPPPPTTPPPAAGPASVSIEDFAYSPDPVRVRAGSSVTWTNADAATHTATADAGGWDSGTLTQGKSGAVRFDTPGTYSYHCTLHPTMKGKVVVIA